MAKIRLVVGLAGTLIGGTIGLGIGGPEAPASAASLSATSTSAATVSAATVSVASVTSRAGVAPAGVAPVRQAALSALSAGSKGSKPLPPSARPGAGRPAAHPKRFVLMSCAGTAAVRPATFALSCGDSADMLIRLHWRNWRRGQAAGNGIQRVNACRPNCAHGTYTRYRVTVLLAGGARVAGHPREIRYTQITLRYIGKRPAGVGRQVTGSLLP